MTTPLASLCVIFRNNADSIQDLLRSCHGHFDEMVFCDTGSDDGTRKVIQTYFKANPTLKSKMVDFEWIDDFGAARQASFEAATGRWRMFLDTDDQLLHGERLRPLLKTLDQKHPEVGALFLPYDYEIDELIQTLRLVRWEAPEGGWEWKDAIHERIEALGPVHVRKTEDVSVKHRYKTEDERRAALVRNQQIALTEYKKTEDEEYKGRLARTIAMGFAIEADIDSAKPFWEEVAAKRGMYPEGRKAAADLMRVYLIAADHKDPEKAREFAAKAGPSYEAIEAYYAGEWDRTIQKQTRAAVIQQQTTHEGFHTEKCYAPLVLAAALDETGAPPDQIERALNSIRPDKRADPEILPGVMSLRRKIDRITILVPNTPQPFSGRSNPTAAMLGGSEEAVYFLSRHLALLGRNVRVYGVLPVHESEGLDEFGVEWCRVENFNLLDEHGHLVVWRAGATLVGILEEIRTRQLAHAKDPKVAPVVGMTGGSFWLHDSGCGFPNGVPKMAAVKACDSVVVLSEHHKKKIVHDLGGDPGNLVCLTNGVELMDFPEPCGAAWSKRDPNRVVYSSCPTRGLAFLLGIWPKVKEACPEAYLDIYYDWSMTERWMPEAYQDIVAAYEKVRHLDVVHHGGVSHAKLHGALVETNVWAYSHFANPDVETSCISAIKATVAGATVLTVPNGALPETVPEAHFERNVIAYRDALIHYLTNPESDAVRADRAKKAADRFGWDSVAKRFSDLWRLPPLASPDLVGTVVP